MDNEKLSKLNCLQQNSIIIFKTYNELIKLEEEHKKNTINYKTYLSLLNILINNENAYIKNEMGDYDDISMYFETLSKIKDENIASIDSMIHNNYHDLLLNRLINKLGNHLNLPTNYDDLIISNKINNQLLEELYVNVLTFIDKKAKTASYFKYNVAFTIPQIEHLLLQNNFNTNNIKAKSSYFLDDEEVECFYSSYFNYAVGNILYSEEKPKKEETKILEAYISASLFQNNIDSLKIIKEELKRLEFNLTFRYNQLEQSKMKKKIKYITKTIDKSKHDKKFFQKNII